MRQLASPLLKSLGSRPKIWALACFLIFAVVFFAYERTLRSSNEQLYAQGQHRLELYLSSVERELARYDHLPTIVALSDHVHSMLRNPTDRALQAKVNEYLKSASERAHVSAVYILNLDGLTLASSNSEDPISFVGVDLSYRPYFQDASKGKSGRFYAIGTTSGIPGYFRAIPIINNGETIGVMALKVSLDRLEAAWKSADEIVAISDGNGVVFLTSLSSWKYKTLSQLAPSVLDQIRTSRQYDGADLVPIGISRSRGHIDRGIAVDIDIPVAGSTGYRTENYLEQSVPVPDSDWKLVLFSDLSAAKSSARNTAVIVIFACGLLLMLVLYQEQRFKVVAAEAATKRALQQAYDHLEQEVTARTIDLRDSNLQLEREIEERKRTEIVLREAQDGLVQASKMAALGQMAAAITHELSQPLAALRNFSDNAKTFLNRNRPEEAQKNLSVITDLIERMASITAQLRSFSRKSPPHLNAGPAKRAMSNAIFLIQDRIEADNISLHCDWSPEELFVTCESGRLDQVFVNLLMNAADSVRECLTRQIDISIDSENDRAIVVVRDSGNGIPTNVLPRLFDPFFTTKDSSIAGLGLGLTIAQEIVRSAGGTLQASNSSQGGAEFSVILPLARTESPHVR